MLGEIVSRAEIAARQAPSASAASASQGSIEPHVRHNRKRDPNHLELEIVEMNRELGGMSLADKSLQFPCADRTQRNCLDNSAAWFRSPLPAADLIWSSIETVGSTGFGDETDAEGIGFVRREAATISLAKKLEES